LPQNLLMLGRTVAILSGMCTGLNPEFNLWGQLAPYATKLVSDEVGSNWKVWLDEIGNVLKELISLPSQVGRVLSQMERGNLSVQVPSVSHQIASLERSVDRLAGGVVFAALFVGGVILYTSGQTWFAWVMFGCAGLVLLWMIFFHGGGSRRFHS